MNDTRIGLTDAQRNRLAPGYNGALEPVKNWDFDALGRLRRDPLHRERFTENLPKLR